MTIYQQRKTINQFISIILGLSLLLSSLLTEANEWYQDYNLTKIEKYSQQYKTTITFFQSSNLASKPSITLIHGVGGSAQDFKALINLLSPDYQLLLPDLPSFGQSKPSVNIYSPNDYANALIEILPSLVKQENIIIGHSMGGNISVQIALTQPLLAKKLVLIDAAGFLNKFSYSKHVASNYVSDNFAFAEHYLPALKNTIDSINQYIPDPSNILLSEKGREYILKNNSNTIAALAVMDEDLSPIIRQKSPPTLILWGEKDIVMPVQVAAMLSYLLNTQHVHIFNGAGHSPQKQFPKQVTNKIVGFLNGINSATKPAIKQVNSNVIIDCQHKDGKVQLLNNAQYLSVTIKNCQNKAISRLMASSLRVINSNVVFTHLTVKTTDNYAMTLLNSNIEIWGGELQGLSVAYIEKSELELNGVDLYSQNALVISNIPSTINASLTNIHLNKSLNNWHGIIDIGF